MGAASTVPSSRRLVLVSGIVLVISAAVLVWAVAGWVQVVNSTQSLAATGVHTSATVAELDGSDGSKYIFPNYAVVRFSAPGNADVSASCPINHVSDYQLGARVAISYDPRQPSRAVLLADPDPPQLVARFFAGVVFGGIVFVLSAILLAVFGFGSRRRIAHYGRHSR